MPGAEWRVLAFNRGEKVELQNQGIFDEVVVDDWLHVEQMDVDCYWVRLGERVFWVRVSCDRKAPSTVTEDEQ